MPKFVLKTLSTFKFGQRNMIPYAGIVTYSDTGEIEVDLKEGEIEKLLSEMEDLILVTGEEGGGVDPIDPQINKNDLGKSQDDEDDFFTGTYGEEDIIDSNILLPTNETEEVVDKLKDSGAGVVDTLSTLNTLKVSELAELAKSSGYPEEEWVSLKKNDLKEYLKSKLEASK